MTAMHNTSTPNFKENFKLAKQNKELIAFKNMLL